MTARSFRRAGQRDRPATTILRGLREQSVRGATCNGPRAVNLAGTRGKRSCLNVASPGRIKAELRLSDALGRFGGEEFVALLIAAKLPEATLVAERIRQSIAEQPLTLADGHSLKVTVSIGVAALGMDAATGPLDTTAQTFVARADHALYAAKQNGRNRVVAAD